MHSSDVEHQELFHGALSWEMTVNFGDFAEHHPALLLLQCRITPAKEVAMATFWCCEASETLNMWKNVTIDCKNSMKNWPARESSTAKLQWEAVKSKGLTSGGGKLMAFWHPLMATLIVPAVFEVEAMCINDQFVCANHKVNGIAEALPSFW